MGFTTNVLKALGSLFATTVETKPAAPAPKPVAKAAVEKAPVKTAAKAPLNKTGSTLAGLIGAEYLAEQGWNIVAPAYCKDLKALKYTGHQINKVGEPAKDATLPGIDTRRFKENANGLFVGCFGGNLFPSHFQAITMAAADDPTQELGTKKVFGVLPLNGKGKLGGVETHPALNLQLGPDPKAVFMAIAQAIKAQVPAAQTGQLQFIWKQTVYTGEGYALPSNPTPDEKLGLAYRKVIVPAEKTKNGKKALHALIYSGNLVAWRVVVGGQDGWASLSNHQETTAKGLVRDQVHHTRQPNLDLIDYATLYEAEANTWQAEWLNLSPDAYAAKLNAASPDPGEFAPATTTQSNGVDIENLETGNGDPDDDVDEALFNV